MLARSNVPRVDRVNFALSVGIMVPTHVHVVAVPPALIEIHPAWRGHMYFVVEEDIVIVNRSREIVAVVPLGPSQARVGSGTVVSLSEDEIREVQLVLIERGFLVGEADGIFGPLTREALITFQRREGLQATGRIDTRTVTALNLSDRIAVEGARGAPGRQPSTVGGGRDETRQSPRTRGETRQSPSRRDVDEQRRGPTAPQQRSTSGQDSDQPSRLNQRQQRSTTGQDNDQPSRLNQGQQRSTADQDSDQPSRVDQGKQRSTTGQGSDQPSRLNQDMQPGQRDRSGASAPSTTGQDSDRSFEQSPQGRSSGSSAPRRGQSGDQTR